MKANTEKWKFRKGWHYGVSFFFVLSISAISRFIFGGHSFREDWRLLIPGIVIAFVGAIVAGIAMRGVSKWEKNRK